MVKVSIIVPVYNVEKYLRQCIDSIVEQTLQEIEIICVNDGSTDSSLSILQEYANADPRIKIIDKENSGYGASMNQGLALASGEYIGIVESDDYAEPDMFERLYRCASEQNLDACKAGYYHYYTEPEERSIPCPLPFEKLPSAVFCPATELSSLRRRINFFGIRPTIWSAIYRREFLTDNDIRFLETPGASFQDTAFNFKVWALATRVKLMAECFLHYRQDNTDSSIKSADKVFCVCEEFAEISAFLEKHPTVKPALEPVLPRLKYDAYIWNYDRLNDEKALEFIREASAELASERARGICVRKAFPWYKWRILKRILKNPDAYHQKTAAERREIAEQHANAHQTGKWKRMRQKAKNLGRCVRDHGFLYSAKELRAALTGKPSATNL
ncbi:MAG: glycosyltransferase [Clostridia bacterium]|nr:glycosyltransferase [Clostridia bacterium]